LRGHIEVIQILIDAGADVHVSNDCVINQAAFNGHIEVVRLLLAVGINPRAASDAPLRHAASHGHTEIVRLLLAAGADPVTAWLTSKSNRRRDIAASFDACADAMTPTQRAALTAASDLFVGLNAAEKSALQHQGLQR
jgi:ankyrin repeat protein